MKYYFLILILGLIGCTTNKPSTTSSGSGNKTEPVDQSVQQERISLQWEVDPVNKSYEPWTDEIVKDVTTHLEKFKAGQDWPKICPKWNNLNDRQKTRVIGVGIVGTIWFESGYNKLSRMQETTMGKDPVTGKPVFSEGLLQLSYQDIQWAPWCEFDWSKDKNLDPKDPRKTILDPYKNLACGIRIMANQVEKKQLFFPKSGYWAVQNTGSKYTQVPGIKAKIAKYAPECR